MHAVHVRLADGTVRTGFDAWRMILAELDGWRWLARAAGLPGLNHVGRSIYSLMARNRHRFRVGGT
jgi:predicted DCC family thiol-disulfide oxidoreductase YuxK